ncbi:thiol reductant ABC exporter subunit CydD [Oscillospiraceae bacterium WX1]
MKEKRLFTEVKGNRSYQVHLVLSGLTSFLLSLTVALLASFIINAVFLRGLELKSMVPMLFALLAGVLARAGLTYYFSLYFRNTAADIKRRVLARNAEALLDSGPILTKSKDSGGVSAISGEAAELLEPYYYEYLPALFSLAVSLPLILVSVLSVDFVSFLIMLVTGPVLPFFLYLIGTESEKASRARLKSLTRLGGGLNDLLSGLKTLKLFGRIDSARAKVASISEDFRRLTMQVLRISFLSAFVLELAATISTAIIAVTLGARLIDGRIDFLPCFFILLMTPDYFMAIRRFGAKFHVAQNAKTAAELLLEPKLPSSVGRKPGLTFPADCDVSFRGVTCSYNRGEAALACVNLDFRCGEITALVGPSGSGKSSIANTLLKLITPEDGAVFVGGVNLAEIDTESLRRSISYIPQRPYIFKGTLRENITLSTSKATDDAVEAAVRDALLGDLVAALPGGLDTPVADMAINFSAGERQRIAIARALLKDAPIVVIDEAVSAQDRENERLLTKSFERLSRDKTVLIIAHRLETVQNADKIYVLNGGAVTEEGCHNDLMTLGGRYCALVRSWG